MQDISVIINLLLTSIIARADPQKADEEGQPAKSTKQVGLVAAIGQDDIYFSNFCKYNWLGFLTPPHKPSGCQQSLVTLSINYSILSIEHNQQTTATYIIVTVNNPNIPALIRSQGDDNVNKALICMDVGLRF